MTNENLLYSMGWGRRYNLFVGHLLSQPNKYIPIYIQFISVQLLRRVQLFATPWTTPHQAFLSITKSQSLLKLMSIELVMPSNHLILCRPLLLPSIFPSIRVFSNESALRIRWPDYWSFSFNICSSNEHPGLISFRTDWLDLLAMQGTLKSLLQHHSSKASILRCSALFIVRLSHPYMTTVKTIALTRQTFVDKVLSLLFNMLSSLEGCKCNKIKSRIWRPTNWRTVIPKKFSHSCEDSELCVRLPSLRILQRHWDPQGI